MPEVIYYVAASLDGFIATPDGGVEWLSPFEAAGEDYGYAEFYGSMDAVLMGSRTYEQVLSFGAWPYPQKPVWVFSRRSLKVADPGVTLTAASPLEVMRELDARGCRRAWLVGGGSLAASFRTRWLITEYVVSLMPVILGGGVPLVGASAPAGGLQLTGCSSFPGGVVQLRYREGSV